MSDLRILIIGASIAGPATAYWLSKTGARITVIERFPEMRTGGQAIDIRTVGVSVMRKMPGMEAAVRAKSTLEEGVSFVDSEGRPYGVIRATGDPDRQSLISEFEIFRGDLAGVLCGFTREREGVRYVFGEQVVSMRQAESGDGPVEVEFLNGLATQEFDLVVACDGAFSRSRAMGLGCGVREHVVPTGCWTAYFSTKGDLLDGGRIGLGLSLVGGRAVTLGSDPRGFSRAMLMGVSGRRDGVLPFREAAAKGDEALKEYLVGQYRGGGWMTDVILKEMMDSDDFYASEIVQVKTPSLYKGRFVMVGDAGYAAGPTGGGTSLALAGAYMLAGEIGKHKGNVAAGLEGYEQKMKPIIKELQKIPPFIFTVLAPQTAWGISIRNHIFAFVAWTGIAERIQGWFGSGFSGTEKFPLPEYNWVS